MVPSTSKVVLQAPPARTSRVQAVTLCGLGHEKVLQCSGVVQQLYSNSRGALMVRVSTRSSSGSISIGFHFQQSCNIGLQPVGSRLPIGALGRQPFNRGGQGFWPRAAHAGSAVFSDEISAASSRIDKCRSTVGSANPVGRANSKPAPPPRRPFAPTWRDGSGQTAPERSGRDQDHA